MRATAVLSFVIRHWSGDGVEEEPLFTDH